MSLTTKATTRWLIIAVILVLLSGIPIPYVNNKYKVYRECELYLSEIIIIKKLSAQNKAQTPAIQYEQYLINDPQQLATEWNHMITAKINGEDCDTTYVEELMKERGHQYILAYYIALFIAVIILMMGVGIFLCLTMSLWLKSKKRIDK